MNEEQKALARKVLDQADREPETLNMGAWEAYADRLYDWKTGEQVEGCGTTRCVAGWAVALSAQPGEAVHQVRLRIADENGLSTSWSEVGRHLLGLDFHESERLFFELDESAAVDYLRSKIGE